MEKNSKLMQRARAYAEEVWKEGDEPTLITFRSVKSYKDGALAERDRIRRRFADKIRELKVQMEHTRGLINELEKLVNPHSD